MPEKIAPEDIKGWITVGGKKVPIKRDQDPESATREHLPNKQAEERKIKEETKKSFEKRFNIIKSKFNVRDEVVFDQFTKEGMVYGFEGDYLRIVNKDNHYIRPANDVFKKSELIGDIHWDTMTNRDRLEILEKSHLSQFYINKDWYELPQAVTAVIQKGISPAGYGGGSGISTTTPAVWNPVNDNKTISERIKETKEQSNEEKRKD